MKRSGIFGVRVLAVLLVMAVLLCGVPAMAAAADGGAGESILVFMPYLTDTMQRAAAEYEQLTGTKVELLDVGAEEFPPEVYFETLRVSVEAGSAPDVVSLPGLPADVFVVDGTFADLSGAVDGLGLNEEILESYRQEDGIYSLPVAMTTPVLLVNRTLLDGAGLSLTDGMTVSEFAELCRSAAEKLPDGVAVYGAAEPAEEGSIRVGQEFNLEGYTYTSPYERGNTDFNAAGLAQVISGYSELDLALSELEVSGSADAAENIGAVQAGSLLFARCDLGDALAAVSGNSGLEFVSFPSVGGAPLEVTDTVSVLNGANREAALGFVEFLIGDFQNTVAREGGIALDGAANAEYFTGAALGIVERATDVSFYGALSKPLDEVYPDLFSYPIESIEVLTERAWNMKNDLDALLGTLEPAQPASTVKYTSYAGLIAVVALSLAMVGAAVYAVIRRRRELMRIGQGRKYGEEMYRVNGKRMKPLVIVPVVMLGNTVIGSVLSRFRNIILCEKAIVIVSWGKVKALRTDAIDKIYTASSDECMIVPKSGKPVRLRTGAYRELGDKLNLYARDVGLTVA